MLAFLRKRRILVAGNLWMLMFILLLWLFSRHILDGDDFNRNKTDGTLITMSELYINPEIVTEQKGALGIITLSRPEKLNALTLDMVRMISVALRRWKKNDEVKAVVFRGAGDRAFCAGGDIVSFYYAGMDYRRGNIEMDVASLFFAEEYTMNKELFAYPKPIISLMDGITMGGGFGIAGNTQYRVCTENTVFAMPETRIGFFTDVGCVYHLNKLNPRELGRYLIVTGESLKGRDVYECGLGTHMADAKDFGHIVSDMQEALSGVSEIEAVRAGVETVLARYEHVTGDSHFVDENIDWVKDAFQHTQIDRILSDMEEMAEQAARDCYETILSRSPTSVMVCLEYFNRSASMDFDAVMNMDFVLAQNFIRGHDFYEGIRATLIDRDKNPHWEPSDFVGVTENGIEQFFKSGGKALDEIEIFA